MKYLGHMATGDMFVYDDETETKQVFSRSEMTAKRERGELVLLETKSQARSLAGFMVPIQTIPVELKS